MQIKITVQFHFHLQMRKILIINADEHVVRIFSYTADGTVNWNYYFFSDLALYINGFKFSYL